MHMLLADHIRELMGNVLTERLQLPEIVTQALRDLIMASALQGLDSVSIPRDWFHFQQPHRADMIDKTVWWLRAQGFQVRAGGGENIILVQWKSGGSIP